MSNTSPSSTADPTGAASRRRRLKLRHLLFLLLLLSGIVPLLISNLYLIGENEDTLKTQETERLTFLAQAFADGLSDDLAQRKDQLRLLGRGLLAPPGLVDLKARLQEEWVQGYLQEFTQEFPEIIAFRLITSDGTGIRSEVADLPPQAFEKLAEAYDETLRTNAPVYRLVMLPGESGIIEAGVILAVPFAAATSNDGLVIEILMRQDLSPSLSNPVGAGGLDEDGEADDEGLFLIDAGGQRLWSPGVRPEIEEALRMSDLVQGFRDMPSLSLTREYDLQVGDRVHPTLGRIVQVEETGWGVVAHKPAAQAFREVEQMRTYSLISSVLLIILALMLALLAARWFSQPIQRMVQATHEIATGNFGRRVETKGLTFEIADLAEDFNRMGEYVQSYIEQLQRAAEENRQLFISSIRAFAAAIDAKDPYTRGHSERVAAYSRSISEFLGLPKDVQERVWISGLLHDVGKIGVEDRVLNKQGVLTPEEFDQMKQHPVIGAEIVKPISALEEMLPGIRWHHEAWNGSGYPDRLKAEQIPMMARIIGVADTFDAITTNRPYQNAYSDEYALQTIKKLTGTKFDARIVTAFLLAYEAGHINEAKERVESQVTQVRMPSAQVAVQKIATPSG